MVQIYLLVLVLSINCFSQNTSGSWTQLNPPTKPSIRDASILTQVSDSELILFGGYDGSNIDETWIFNNTSSSWTQLNPPTKPSARRGSMMARISNDEVLLFGGKDADYNDETWIFNNSSGSWTQLFPPSSPDAIQTGMMSRISDDEVLLFGGYDDNYINETWIFNNTSGSWTQLSPQIKPIGRRSCVMSRISDDEVVLFGGYDGSTNLDDTWIFNNISGSWTQLSPPSEPSARRGAMMSRISDDGILLFGGYDGARSNETWIFNILDTEPTTHSNTFAQIGESNNSITFSFQSLNAISADGYLILKSTSNIENPVDATSYSVDDNIGSTLVVGKITDVQATNFVLTNQQFQKSYTFRLVPFNVGTKPITTNYFNTNAPTINAYTIPTLGEWGMMAFVGLMAFAGVFYIKNRIV